MGVLNISDIEIGMELAADVVNPQGRSLLKAGSILREKHLMAFKAWGVTEADIKDAEPKNTLDTALAAISEATIQQIDQELAFLFQKCDMGNEIVAEIHRLVKKRSLLGCISG